MAAVDNSLDPLHHIQHTAWMAVSQFRITLQAQPIMPQAYSASKAHNVDGTLRHSSWC